MVNVKLVREMPFAAAAVWNVLQDFGDMGWTGAPDWDVIGEGIGMTRRVKMEGMDPIDEVLETMDAEAMSFTYTIPRGLPLPVTDYRAGGAVRSIDAERCEITWTCTCTPTDESMSTEDVDALMKATYSSLLDGLEARLQGV